METQKQYVINFVFKIRLYIKTEQFLKMNYMYGTLKTEQFFKNEIHVMVWDHHQILQQL